MVKRKKSVLALFLAVIMLFSVFPFNASHVSAESEILYGDVNGDKVIDEADAELLEKYLAEYDVAINLAAADVNADGIVDLADLLLLKKYLAGQDVILGETVTVTFHTNGGIPVNSIRLKKGTALSTVVYAVPSTQKDGYIFTGWVKADGSDFYADDEIDSDIDLYASYTEVPPKEKLEVNYFSLEDQNKNLTFTLITDSETTSADLKTLLVLYSTDGSDPKTLVVSEVTNTEFTVTAEGGFNEGSSYKLILPDGVYFKDKEITNSTVNFTIYKAEVNNITFSDDIIYIKDNDYMWYSLDGSDISIPVLQSAMLNSKDENPVTGYFTYNGSPLNTGDLVCIYQFTHPENRDYINHTYSDDALAYIEIVGVIGDKVYFKALGDEDADKVIFIPDTIPFSVTTLPAGTSGTVYASAYDKAGWAAMGYTGTPVFDKGDFLVFYTGAFTDMTDSTPVYFGKVVSVDGDVISYVQTTAEAIVAALDLFLRNPIDSDELLKNIDTGTIERQIERQALESGFASAAAAYLAGVARQTNGFTDLSLSNLTVTTASGQPMSLKTLMAIGKEWRPTENVKVRATVGKSSKYFKNGVKLALEIEAEFGVDVGEEGELKILLKATFVEEVAVNVDLIANAKVKWYLFVPVFKSLSFGASVDLKNYSAISVDVKVYTVEKEEEGLWSKLKDYFKDYGDELEKLEELRDKIKEGKESAETVKKYLEDIDKIWQNLSSVTKGELTRENYENLISELGELNVTGELLDMLGLTDDEEINAGIADLMERYSEMLETESDWITLVEKEIFDQDINILIFAVGIEVDFVIKANVNVALGANLEYVVGKRYSFWYDIIGKTSGSSTVDILDERFAFQFYVMGTIGLKMGIKSELKAGVISTKIGSIGVSTEFGPYVKLWGFFIYEYTKLRPANTNTWQYGERMMGALYFEFGLYIEVAFKAQILDGAISYNPTLLDKEIPLLTAGRKLFYYDFGYELDKDEVLLVEDSDRNSNTGITMTLPESYRLMKYLNLVEGNLEQEVMDYSNFAFTLSNRNFTFDANTGLITVNVPQNVQYMECILTITWKKGKLEFTNKDISVSIPLVWTSLSTEELKQKFTVTVKVGNPNDGYVAVWSDRVKKNTSFDLPTYEKILELIGYDNYSYSSENLKYKSITGYTIPATTGLAVYTDTIYYFDVYVREYTLTVKNVQDSQGAVYDMQFKAKYGQNFNISQLYETGARNAIASTYTAYLSTAATLDGQAIDNDISRIIDNRFAKQLLSGAVYTARYADNSVNATFTFTGDGIDLADISVRMEKGSVPPASAFMGELVSRGYTIKSITPAFTNITADTAFIIECEKSLDPSYNVIYHTNGGSNLEDSVFQYGSVMFAPANPAKTGYNFADWYSDAELTIPFDFSTATMPNHDMHLYAKWEGEKYTVIFDPNEGVIPVGSSNQKTVTYGEKYGDLPVPARTGFKFAGWWTSRTGGTQISATSTVAITDGITLYARWTEKSTINPSVITYATGQKTVYNGLDQPFRFSTGSFDKSTFLVYYKRQSLDNEYTTKAINAGIYDIKIVRQENENFKYFETLLTGVYIIEKAQSYIYTKPTGSAYYGNIVADTMRRGVDFVSDGEIMFAVSPYNFTKYFDVEIPVDWRSSYVVYNVYDKFSGGQSLYLWVKIAEGENYKASDIIISDNPINITQKPEPLLRKPGITYKVVIKTSNISQAGTNSKISVAIGNGLFQHLDKPGDDFERNNEDTFDLSISPYDAYNTAYGTIPLTLKYEKSGTNPGWHCAWIRIDVYKDGKRIIVGDQYNVNHWFGAEDYNKSTITETYNLTGFARNILNWGIINGEREVEYVTNSYNNSVYQWWWGDAFNRPLIFDQYCTGAPNVNLAYAYNPYEYLNAPELTVSFNIKKYNDFIEQGVNVYFVDKRGLYGAMVEDGVRTLTLTTTLEFKPVNGNYSATPGTAKRVTTTTFICTAVPENNVYASIPAKNYFKSGSEGLVGVTKTVTSADNGTFDVSYYLSENTGIWGTKFAVNYDKNLVELTGYTLGDVFGESNVIPPEFINNDRYVFFATRDGFIDTTNTGRLVTLRFKIKDGASITDDTVTLDEAATQSINVQSSYINTQISKVSPKIRVIGNTNVIAKGDNVIITALAGNSAIKSVEVKKDGGEYADITETYQNGYAITENGEYTFRVTTQTGETATTSLTYTLIDRVKPVISIDTGDYAEGTWTNGQVILSVTNSSANLGETVFDYKIGNGEWTTYVSPIVAQKTNGEVVYSFKATSQSGMESDVSTVTVKYDNLAPEGEIILDDHRWSVFNNSLLFKLFFNSVKTITITGSDANSGISRIEYILADEETDVSVINNWLEYNGPVTINPNGKYVLYAKITDNTGNFAVINSEGIVLENTKPVIDGFEDGKTYCGMVEAVITDENLDKVTLNGKEVTLADGKLTLIPAEGVQVVTATDKAGNITTVTVTVNDGHTWDEGMVTTQPTSTSKGAKTYTCIHCGDTKTEDIDKLPPVVVGGEYGEWRIGNNNPLTITCDALVSDFVNVEVDGNELDNEHYTVTEGSTVITIKAEYLATLEDGVHTVKISFTTGFVSVDVTILPEEDESSEGTSEEQESSEPASETESSIPEIPVTGDNPQILLWLGIVLLIVAANTVIKRRKSKA